MKNDKELLSITINRDTNIHTIIRQLKAITGINDLNTIKAGEILTVSQVYVDGKPTNGLACELAMSDMLRWLS